MVSDGEHVAVGTVRLDNRAELQREILHSGRAWTDLELVLHLVARHGTKFIPTFLGDFAFVIWNPATRTVTAARDAFGVKRLYYAKRDGLWVFAARAEALALDDRYNVEYLAGMLAACTPSPEHTVYVDVKSVPAGAIAVIEGGMVATRQYWSAYDFEPLAESAESEREAVETCRNLLAAAVQSQLSSGATWAQLSGGIDSSSVVSIAQWLVERGTITRGLAGTVTYVDSHGTGADEREYSDAVVRRWRIPNELIVDSPIWCDDQCDPPRLDQPNVGLVFYPRDRQLCAGVQGAGGRVLLTGAGGDNLFTGNMFFFADWLASGRVFATLREMGRRAAMGRASFWELAYRNALLPLLPGHLLHRIVQEEGQIPPWVPRAMAELYGLYVRGRVPASYAGCIGNKYQHAVAVGIAMIAGAQSFDIIEDKLDVRHPFLYRPLVEFALRLRPELCVRPNARKWVLREAMRDILPEAIRTRVGKSAPYGRLAWSLTTQRAVLEPLVREPILADLGLVDASRLRAFFDAAPRKPQDRQELHGALHATLAIEAWLQLRSGRWPPGGYTGRASLQSRICRPRTGGSTRRNA